MKTFINSILLFIPFSTVMYILLLIVWGDCVSKQLKTNLNYKIGSYGHMHSRLRNIETEKDIDILFLGSSRAYRGFDPRIFEQYGLHTFNLGSGSQTPLQTEILLKRYLDKLNPSFIVYEVHPETFTSDGVESSLDIIANDKIDRDMIGLALRQNHIKTYNNLIYGLYRDFFKKDISYKEEIIKDDDTYIPGGFVEKKIKYYDYVKYKKTSEWKFNQKQFDALDNIIFLLKQHNTPFIFVQVPSTQAKYKWYSNNNDFDHKIKKLGDYYNFNEIIRLDNKLHFFDSRHLNQDGVKIFDTKLLEILLKKGSSTPRQTKTK